MKKKEGAWLALGLLLYSFCCIGSSVCKGFRALWGGRRPVRACGSQGPLGPSGVGGEEWSHALAHTLVRPSKTLASSSGKIPLLHLLSEAGLS